MSKLKTLTDGFIEQLRDLYSAEQQLVKALPKMERKATNESLKEAFRSHLQETEQQVQRLEKIGTMIKTKLSGKTCKAMQGLIEEGKEVLESESENDALIDALLIAAAQRVEHYEIAAYGTARAMALQLDEDAVASTLQETLEEEGAADKKLSSISEDEVLCDADSMSSDNESENEDQKSVVPAKASRKRNSSAARALVLLGCLAFANYSSVPVLADDMSASGKTQYQADNTGRNARDQTNSAKTADSQKLAGTENEVLARVRREIVANDNLSTNGQNIKILVENGTVWLRGPVQSRSEKTWIESTATRAASGYRVVNELEIAPG